MFLLPIVERSPSFASRSCTPCFSTSPKLSSSNRTWPWSSCSMFSSWSSSRGSTASATPSAITATPSRRPPARRFKCVPTRMSTMRDSGTGRLGNSSGISVTVAPTALPIPSARWPALRPMATMTYQRDVVLASTIKLLTSSTPTWRAV